ncbi:MAG: hypothetical protein ACR2KP_12720 [Egibacteraceae bacterium]
MTASVAPARVSGTGSRGGAPGRLAGALAAAWGAFTGVLPHVLHHVGPLAGTALVAGAGGRWLFAGVGLAATIPPLIRVYRRFRTWLAPALAVAVFAAMFALSTLVVGPLISGRQPAQPLAPTSQQHPGHSH